MTVVLTATIAGRTLVDPGLFGRLSRSVAKYHHMDLPYAERIIDQTLAFLATAAVHASEPLTPSPTVDKGWHKFLERTADYAEFCQKIAGRFIHHVPDDDDTLDGDAPDGPAEGEPGQRVRRTLEAITAAGYRVDHEMWMTGGKCSSCHEDSGCRSGGEDGNENTETRKPPPGQ